MERPSTLRVGETLTTERGVTLSAQKQSPTRRIAPGHTALHEAAHIIAAQSSGGIRQATIIATSEYAGATWPVQMTAASAMAAAAMGFDGTGWDEYLTEHILGVDPNGARGSALSSLAGKQDEMHAVAQKLEEHGTIGQTEVNTAFQEVHERRQGIWDVALEVTDQDGVKEVHEVKSLNDHVMVPGEVYAIGKEEKEPAVS